MSDFLWRRRASNLKIKLSNHTLLDPEILRKESEKVVHDDQMMWQAILPPPPHLDSGITGTLPSDAV